VTARARKSGESIVTLLSRCGATVAYTTSHVRIGESSKHLLPAASITGPDSPAAAFALLTIPDVSVW
jgi:hypothetical protein